MTEQDKAEFLGFCRNATDDQLRNIYAKESLARRSAYAAIAKTVMHERGLA